MRSRAGEPGLGEVILATGATVDGQTTAHYLTERLAGCDVTVTDMAIVAALVSLGVVYWLARRTKGLGGAIWGIPIQTRRNRYG